MKAITEKKGNKAVSIVWLAFTLLLAFVAIKRGSLGFAPTTFPNPVVDNAEQAAGYDLATLLLNYLPLMFAVRYAIRSWRKGRE